MVQGDPATGIVALTFDAGTEGGGSAPEVLQILRDRGLHVTFLLSGHWVDHNPELASIYWTIDSGDWLPRATPGAVADKILRYAQPGDIVVEHVGSDATAAALPTVLDDLQRRGIRVGTVSEMLGLTP